MKDFEKYADNYMESQHPTRAYDYQGKKMTWKRAGIYTLFDSFFFGLKWAIFVIFFLTFWSIFNANILTKFAENVCPLMK